MAWAISASTQQALAQAGEGNFYHGKTISVIVPQGPGGAYDSFARLVSGYLGKHIPGHPTVVVRNMPGGGGVISTNYVYNVAPRDGTTLIVITSTFSTDQLLGMPQVKYDARHFPAIGRLADTTSVLTFWHESAIKKTHDLHTTESIIALSSLNNVFSMRVLVMNQVLNTKMKPIGGYPSARDYALATQRREADGFWSPFVALRQAHAGDLAQGRFKVLLQFSFARLKELVDVPTMLELSGDPNVQKIFRFLASNDEIGRSLFTTPNVPPAQMTILQSAFNNMLDDPSFKSEAEKRGLPLSPKSADEIQAIVQDTFDTPPGLLSEIRRLTKQ